MGDDSDLRDCANCLCLASRQAARAITSSFDRHLRPYGVRATQFTILTNLMLRGPMALGALADCLTLERTTLTRNLALMEEHGWVETQSTADDSRVRIVVATDRGKSLVRKAYPGWRAAQDQVEELVGRSGAAGLRELAKAVGT